MLDRQAVLDTLGCGLTIEVVVQNGFDGAEGVGADLQRSMISTAASTFALSRGLSGRAGRIAMS
jgi:hypothetical protein